MSREAYDKLIRGTTPEGSVFYDSDFVKIAENCQLKHTIDEIAQRIYQELLAVGSGKRGKAEKLGYDKTLDIYTTGPTL